jgi:hypothetical protein
MKLIIYAPHGINKAGVDLGECPEGVASSESRAAHSIAMHIWQILANQNIYTFLLRPADGSVCRDRYNQIAPLGDLILEIHVHSDAEQITLQGGAIDPVTLKGDLPVVCAVCPFDVHRESGYHFMTAFRILALLRAKHPEVFEASPDTDRSAAAAVSRPCSERRS